MTQAVNTSNLRKAEATALQAEIGVISELNSEATSYLELDTPDVAAAITVLGKQKLHITDLNADLAVENPGNAPAKPIVEETDDAPTGTSTVVLDQESGTKEEQATENAA